MMSLENVQTTQCPQCDYKATTKVSIQTHIRSTHYREFFPCPTLECEFKTSQKTYLQKHIKAIHEGLTLSCSDCDYKTSFKKIS